MTREEAIKHAEWMKEYGLDNKTDEFLDMAIKALEEEPKTGHWIYLKNESNSFVRVYKCSVCGWKIDSCRGLMQDTGHRLFCEHCGADMRTEAIEEQKERETAWTNKTRL